MRIYVENILKIWKISTSLKMVSSICLGTVFMDRRDNCISFVTFEMPHAIQDNIYGTKCRNQKIWGRSENFLCLCLNNT